MPELFALLGVIYFLGSVCFQYVGLRRARIAMMEDHIAHLLSDIKERKEYTKSLEEFMFAPSNIGKYIQLPLPGFENI